jgi:hypothetical protein
LIADFAALGAAKAARTGRVDLVGVDLPTGLRADFDGLLSDARALFALFFTVRPAVLPDRPAVFAECLPIALI